MSAINIAKFSRTFLAGAVLLIAAGLLLSATQAWAETVKGREVFHDIKAEKIEVGDVPGHIVSIIEEKGLVFFEDGEVATMSSVYTLDSNKKGSIAQGYNIRTFEDGSTQVFKWKSTSQPSQEGKPYLFKGTYSFIGGSGRFKGIHGSGSCSGKGFASIATGYLDFTETYTLPKK